MNKKRFIFIGCISCISSVFFGVSGLIATEEGISLSVSVLEGEKASCKIDTKALGDDTMFCVQ